ncbi:glycoside hydrolase family 26 protein [Caballeronia arationis]|uniref:glycoside hydrolase family 26 protein n=1 Tax=Caballeronia arationis TaxID=1777142 RepID=UPI0011982609|nr:glycosyl hydrolase [Caballeronia arationis]
MLATALPAVTHGASGTTASPAVAAIGLHAEGDMYTAQYDSFSAWLGNPVLYRIVFTARGKWQDVADPYYLVATQRWINSDPRHVEVMSVPLLLPSDHGFATVTSGKVDHAFASLATNIKAIGRPEQVIIRLGWEHNGKWYPWNALKDPEGYKAAYRRVVNVMRKVAPGLRFDWTTDFQSHSSFDWQSAYPGDDVVDIMSMDVYDEYHKGWDDMLDARTGLQSFRAFAKAHGKPEAYPEWGCSTRSEGYGDNPEFIERFHGWIESGAPNVLYQAYWNTHLGGPNAVIYGDQSGHVPLAAKKYRELFGK